MFLLAAQTSMHLFERNSLVMPLSYSFVPFPPLLQEEKDRVQRTDSKGATADNKQVETRRLSNANSQSQLAAPVAPTVRVKHPPGC